MLMIGAVVAYYITILPVTSSNSNSLLYLFLSGSLAICAMILPGISGSFILLLLGVYKPVLDALHDRDIKTISVIILGAIVGLLSFSRLLKWLFQKYHTLTLALLTGFIFGSLNKIWPWKEILASEMINGKLKILQEQNISPFNYQDGPELLWAIFLAVIGFLVIVILEFTANRTNKI
jgi:putative membrane protein